ncbi:MAG: L,D-transpeptidase family protein [Lachnospiraceae bacterium]|nr:L,D-transpeptidase family protein [Lachnospiraceae bacterium]MCI9589825.1 L,D-transpeptidase family protein [Lachnospiraceae bacterium]
MEKEGLEKENTKKTIEAKLLVITMGATAALFSGMASYYIVRAQHYRERFFPNTVINGVEADGLTPNQVMGQIISELGDYELTLKTRSGNERISGSQIGLMAQFDQDLDTLLEEQNPYAWGIGYFNPEEHKIPTVTVFDQELLDKALDNLDCFNPSRIEKPENAKVSDYIPGTGYEIIPETPGTELNRDQVKGVVASKIMGMEREADLDAAGCYKTAEIREDYAGLKEQCSRLNHYVQTKVTYQFGEKEEILDGDTINQWIIQEEDGTISLDEEQVAWFVEELADKYNTAYTTRSFRTTYGPEVKVSGSYGWRINKKEETAQLLEILKSGESQVREPVYFQKAASYEGNDYGNTYAEVNLTAQHMFFYKDGQMVLESDFVSGNQRRNFTTPPGIFGLTYKQKKAVLKGEGYASPVDFWMPFNGGIGFHDATWRGSFGGTIYKTNGSHGCINMPYAKAKELYDLVYTNVPVICYNLDGTESGKSSGGSQAGKGSGQSRPPVQPSQPVIQETLPAVQPSQPAIQETQPPVQPGLPAPSETPPQSDGSLITPAQPDGQTPGGGPQPSETLPAAPSTPEAQPDSPVITPAGEIGPGLVSTTAADSQPEIGPGV